MKIEFTIIGETVSMKNSRQIMQMGRGRDAKPMLIKSKDAREWEAAIIRQIPKAAKLMLDCDLKATVTVYFKNRVKDVDVELLFDALQTKYEKVPGDMIRIGEGEYERGPEKKVLARAGVYVNDNQVRIKNIDGTQRDKENPRVHIVIESISPVQTTIPVEERQQ